MTQVIMRPVYNRPEMFSLSLEYEIEARKYSNLVDRFITLFVVEHGAPNKTLELIDKYPYSKKIIKRKEKFGLSKNILLGMKDSFEMADNYVVYIEDDILIHKTYFEYIRVIMDVVDSSKYSIISPYNSNNRGDVGIIRRDHHYAAMAPLIDKDFFDDYIRPCVTPTYYGTAGSRHKFVIALNNKYKEYWGKQYKYINAMHNEQAGLINRLVDAALIEENKSIIRPEINRQIHIGYYGKNRPGGKLPGSTFDLRLENLREIIQSGETMYKMSATKQYNDYMSWSPKLDAWDGTLRFKRPEVE